MRWADKSSRDLKDLLIQVKVDGPLDKLLFSFVPETKNKKENTRNRSSRGNVFHTSCHTSCHNVSIRKSLFLKLYIQSVLLCPGCHCVGWVHLFYLCDLSVPEGMSNWPPHLVCETGPLHALPLRASYATETETGSNVVFILLLGALLTGSKVGKKILGAF